MTTNRQVKLVCKLEYQTKGASDMEERQETEVEALRRDNTLYLVLAAILLAGFLLGRCPV